MTIERALAAACAVAGVAVLAGPGWALLAAAAVLAVARPSPQAVKWAQWGRSQARHLWAWAATHGRQAAAVGTMPAGCVLIPVGVFGIAGPGWAILIVGVAAVGVSLLLGWNQKVN